MNITYGSCKIFVQGMDMTCPLCCEVVLSGSSHECEGSAPIKTLMPPKRKAKKAPAKGA